MSILAGLGSLFDRIGGLPSWVVGLGVAALGLGAAWAYFLDAFSWFWLVAVLLVIAATLLVSASASMLLPDKPKEAVETFGWRTLATVLLAGLGAGIVIAIAAQITAPKDAPAENAELVKALAAALAAAVTATLVKASESVDGPTASAAEAAFKKAYEEEATTNSDLQDAVFLDATAGISGWGREARTKRAVLVERARRPRTT